MVYRGIFATIIETYFKPSCWIIFGVVIYNYIFGIDNRLYAMQIAKNIHLNELSCRCGCATPLQVLPHLVTLGFCLQRIRDHFGAAVFINSGYRCTSHNTAVGGASRSFHLSGMAADIRVYGVHPQNVYKALIVLMQKGLILTGGIKCYPTFVHYDIRGTLTKF